MNKVEWGARLKNAGLEKEIVTNAMLRGDSCSERS